MKVYSILIPPLAPATFHKKDGVYYHTQNPKHPKSLSRWLWNATTKTLDKIDDNEITDTIVCPLIKCLPNEVADYVDHQLPSLKEACENIYKEDYNIFVCHSNLHFNPPSIPVYVGLFGQIGIGETLWERSV